MAYTQYPRYGAPHRPPYEDHQPPYGSSGELYAANNGHFNGNPRRGPPQEQQDTKELSGGSYGYDEDWQDQGNSYNGGSGWYEGRGQNRGRRWPPAQRPQERPIGAGRYHHNDPRGRGPPQSKSAPPGRGRYHQQDPYQQSIDCRQPRGQEQQYQPEETYHNGSQEHDNGEYEYDQSSVQTPNTWTPTQHYNRPPHSDDQAYQDPDYNAGYPQQHRGGRYDKGVSSGIYRNDRPRQPEAPASRFYQNPPKSAIPLNHRHPKPCKSANA